MCFQGSLVRLNSVQMYPPLALEGRMPTCSRSISAVVLISLLLGCGGEENLPSEAERPLAVAAACKDEQIVTLLDSMFDSKNERDGLQTCAEAIRLAGKSQPVEARAVVHAFLVSVLALIDSGDVAAAPGLTVAESVVALFHAFTNAIGQDPFPLTPEALATDGVVAQECPDEGCTTTTPNRHAALRFNEGGFRVIVTIEPAQTHYGQCTAFEFEHGHDCFDLQVQVEVFPENKIVTPAIFGTCVVDTGPFAPSGDVASRVRIATEEDGAFVLLPPATPPGTLDCSDLATTAPDGWRGFAEDVGRRLFSVRPAYASPGRLGAAVAAFSPVVPVDPEIRTGSIRGTATSVFDEISGADVTLFDGNGQVVGTTLTDAQGAYVFEDVPIPDASETYSVLVFRNSTLSQQKSVTLTPVPPNRDVVLDFELVPPGY